MSKKHLNSEKNIDNRQFKIRFGTTNCVNTEVIYIEGKTFLLPLKDKDDYNTDINHLRYILKDCVRWKLEHSNDTFDTQRFILDFDIASNGMKIGKKSFLTIQVFLRQKKELSFSDLLKKSKTAVSDIADKFAEEINKQGFSLSKTK